MAKITKITIENFRAFYGKYEFITADADGNGKNILIYGENGSGKSSLYAAIKDFFCSSEPTNGVKFQRNIYAPPTAASYVSFDIDSHSYTFNGSMNTHEKQLFQETLLLEGWLTYRELLKTYLNADETNLYPILWEFWIKHMPSRIDTKSIGDYWKDQVQPSLDNINDFNASRKYTKKRQEERGKAEKKLNELLSDHSNNIRTVIRDITNIENPVDKLTVKKRLNKWLNEIFKVDFEINFDIDVSSWHDIKFAPQIKYNSALLTENYRTFLNEARLSALATCLYLAMLKDKPSPPSGLKVLFLDDIFIGLDMSNRLPLLEILKAEFSDWQIFMTTYDKHWFEVAKKKFNTDKNPSDWLAYEMYVGETTNKNSFTTPFIKKSKSYLELAEFYLGKHQYPECANNLRKALEQKLKAPYFLPSNLLFVETIDSETGEKLITKQRSLNSLLLIFLKYIKDFEFDKLQIAAFEELKNIKDWYLNPFSHDNIETPIYLAELQNAFNLLKKLTAIKIIKVLEAGKDLYFEFNESGEYRKYIVTLLDNLYCIYQGVDIKISNPMIKCIEWHKNTTPHTDIASWDSQKLKSFYQNKKQALEKKIHNNFPESADGDTYFHKQQSLKTIIDDLLSTLNQ